jgi:hypothetical protein
MVSDYYCVDCEKSVDCTYAIADICVVCCNCLEKKSGEDIYSCNECAIGINKPKAWVEERLRNKAG